MWVEVTDAKTGVKGWCNMEDWSSVDPDGTGSLITFRSARPPKSIKEGIEEIMARLEDYE